MRSCFSPELNVSPVVDPSVSFPNVTESVSESEAPDAVASARLNAEPENVYELFSFRLAVSVAVTAGGATALMVRATTPEPLRRSTESVTDIRRVSDPT